MSDLGSSAIVQPLDVTLNTLLHMIIKANTKRFVYKLMKKYLTYDRISF